MPAGVPSRMRSPRQQWSAGGRGASLSPRPLPGARSRVRGPRRMAGLRPPLPLRRLHGPAQPTPASRGGGTASPDRVIVQPAEDPADRTDLHHRAGRHRSRSSLSEGTAPGSVDSVPVGLRPALAERDSRECRFLGRWRAARSRRPDRHFDLALAAAVGRPGRPGSTPPSSAAVPWRSTSRVLRAHGVDGLVALSTRTSPAARFLEAAVAAGLSVRSRAAPWQARRRS